MAVQKCVNIPIFHYDKRHLFFRENFYSVAFIIIILRTIYKVERKKKINTSIVMCVE